MKNTVASLLLFTSLAVTTPIYPFSNIGSGIDTSLDLDPVEYQYKHEKPQFGQKPFTLDINGDDEDKDSNLQSTESPPVLEGQIKNEDNSESEAKFNLPSWSTTHLLARRLLALSTTGVLSTVYPGGSNPSSLAGVPVGLPDYFTDCANNDENEEVAKLLGAGNPLILALNLGTTFRNTKAGSKISLSVDWWARSNGLGEGDNGDGDELDYATANMPRLALMGSLEKLPMDEMSEATREAVEKCFLAAHPDAKYWLPGHAGAAHSGYWARLVVDKALWVGGFGDRARIGWLDMPVWRSVKKSGEAGEEGWGDVRLPGEKE